MAMFPLIVAILLASNGGAQPRLLSNLAEIFGTDSYPEEASEAGEQGRVTVIVQVAQDGRVSDCKIESSSGSTSLDSATCRILQEKARFSPARDASDQAIPGDFRFQTVWALPPVQIVASTYHLILTLDRGTLVECKAIGTAEEPTSCDAPSPANLARLFGERFIDIKKLEMIQTTLPGPARVLGDDMKSTRVTIGEALITLKKDGRVANCSMRSPPETTLTNICSFFDATGHRFSGVRAFVVAFDLVADLPPPPSPKNPKP